MAPCHNTPPSPLPPSTPFPPPPRPVRSRPIPMMLAPALAALAASVSGGGIGDDEFFGERGDAAAGFPRFDAGFPDVGSPLTKNCSVCGGRDGCVDCNCVKGCATPQIYESLPFLSRTLGSHMVLQRAPASAVVYGHAKQGATVRTSLTVPSTCRSPNPHTATSSFVFHAGAVGGCTGGAPHGVGCAPPLEPA